MDPSTLIPRLRRAGVDVNGLLADPGGLHTTATPGRVAELHRELRTTVLDTRFQFLPHGMVGSIKKMLADGRLTAWEREALEDLLDREEALSQAQKDQVRAQLDRWFGDDAGLADAGTDHASRG